LFAPFRAKGSSKIVTVAAAAGRMAATSPRSASICRLGGRFFPSCSNYIADVDSPRAVVPVGTGSGVRMPGSFECDDDDEAELDALVVGIRKLGV